MKCLSCFTGDMQKPVDNHPAYIYCPNCSAIELTYEPQEYQMKSHEVPYVERNGRIQTHLIGYFGG